MEQDMNNKVNDRLLFFPQTNSTTDLLVY